MLPEDTLCHRRERVLLATAAGVLLAAVLLIALGADTTISLAELSPVAITPNALIPAGAIACPLGILAVVLACETLGTRSARALVGLGIVAMAIALGVIAALGRGETELAYAAGFLATTFVTVEMFAAIGRATRGRKLALRYLVSTITGVFAGAFAFGAAARAIPIVSTLESDAVALDIGAYLLAVTLVAWLPMMLVMRLTTVALRTKPFRKTFTTEEIAFFDRGDLMDQLEA